MRRLRPGSVEAGGTNMTATREAEVVREVIATLDDIARSLRAIGDPDVTTLTREVERLAESVEGAGITIANGLLVIATAIAATRAEGV
jgi:hypothetical protein